MGGVCDGEGCVLICRSGYWGNGLVRWEAEDCAEVVVRVFPFWKVVASVSVTRLRREKSSADRKTARGMAASVRPCLRHGQEKGIREKG